MPLVFIRNWRNHCLTVFVLLANFSIVTREALSATQVAIDTTEPAHRWDRYVQGFRKDHNLAIMVGRASGSWELQQFGSLSDVQIKSSSYFLKAHYSFHLPLWRKFGYALGSSLGILYDTRPRGNFQSTLSVHLPGFYIAAVYSPNPSFRVSFGLDNYLERIDGLQETAEDVKNSLNATMSTWLDSSISLDYFKSLKSAVRAEFHIKRSVFKPLAESHNNASDTMEAMESSAFKKTERWFALGWVYHFL